MTKDTGGQVFPVDYDDGTQEGFKGFGMTLRQYYAGQSLIAYMACSESVNMTKAAAKELNEEPHKFLAKLCFQQADAMISEGREE